MTSRSKAASRQRGGRWWCLGNRPIPLFWLQGIILFVIDNCKNAIRVPRNALSQRRSIPYDPLFKGRAFPQQTSVVCGGAQAMNEESGGARKQQFLGRYRMNDLHLASLCMGIFLPITERATDFALLILRTGRNKVQVGFRTLNSQRYYWEHRISTKLSAKVEHNPSGTIVTIHGEVRCNIDDRMKPRKRRIAIDVRPGDDGVIEVNIIVPEGSRVLTLDPDLREFPVSVQADQPGEAHDGQNGQCRNQGAQKHRPQLSPQNGELHAASVQAGK